MNFTGLNFQLPACYYFTSVKLFPIYILLLVFLASFTMSKETVPVLPHSCIDVADSTAHGLSQLDTIITGKRIFVIGEMHGTTANPKLFMKMLRYLYAKANVRHIIMEYGPAECYLMQRYLDSGDEKWVEDSWLFKMPEYKQMLNELYAFNSAAVEKVDLIGLDFDSDHLFAKAVSALMPKDKVIPETIKPMMDSVAANNARTTSFTSRKFIEQFQADYELQKDEYRNYFGDNFGYIVMFTGNDASFKKFNDRDRQMALNFTGADDGDTTRNYFGMFGWSHVYRNDTRSFIYRVENDINKYPDFYHKAICFGIAYDSCSFMYKTEYLLPAGDALEFVKAKDSETIMDAFSRQAKCDVAFFDTRNSGNELIERVNAHFDLTIYIRKSKACRFTE